MPRAASPLGEFEQLVLLAVLRVGRDDGEAYGIPVYEELLAQTGRRIARGAVYMTLDRLEKKGLLTSYLTAPTAARGGRGRRCYRATKAALAALAASRLALERLWAGVRLGGG